MFTVFSRGQRCADHIADVSSEEVISLGDYPYPSRKPELLKLVAKTRNLSPLQRRYLYLILKHGQSVTSIAKGRGVSKSSVSERLKQAIKHINNCYKKTLDK